MKEIKPELETFARIKVVGVGGGGNHAISRMAEANLKGIDFIAVNTDAQDLHHCKVQEKIHIGKNLTRGLGAGMNPDMGRQAAEENKDEIQDALKNSDMVFVTCGLGGGTGTGAAPIIAEVAKESGALTVGVVTKPFLFEGIQRRRIADEGLEILRRQVDAIITVPNDKLLQIIDKKTLLLDSFKIVDDVLRHAVQGISDLITMPGIVNVDFADVKAVMENTGTSLMGIGKASGDNRAADAARQAINSPLLDISINGAKGVLFNISGGPDLTMMEVNEAANVIVESIDPEAKVIFGAITDENLKKGEIKVTVIATGFGDEQPKGIITRNIIKPFSGIPKTESRIEKFFEKEGLKKDAEEKVKKSDDKKEKETRSPLEEALMHVKPEPKPKLPEEVQKAKAPQDEKMFSSKINPLKYNEEYDIPAFIRRKLNKKNDEDSE